MSAQRYEETKNEPNIKQRKTCFPLVLCSLNRTFGFTEGTHVNFVFLCHDSAKHASMMALAAPSVRKNPNKFGFSLT
jgi:hypothetical protein